MSPTLDERATVSDPRYTQHVARSAFLLAVHRAIELDGMPAPVTIGFDRNDAVRLVMDPDATADVDDWARHLGIETARIRNSQTYTTKAAPDWYWHGYRLIVWCVAKVGAR